MDNDQNQALIDPGERPGTPEMNPVLALDQDVPIISTLGKKYPNIFDDLPHRIQSDIDYCAKEWTVHTHIGLCGAKVAVPKLCKNRLCPTCRPKWVHVQHLRILKSARKMKSPMMIVLTIRNSDNLAGMVADMKRWFGKLRRSKLWKKHIKGGGIVGSGLTVGRKGAFWHYHLHILVDCKYFPAIGPAGLSALWRKITLGEGINTKVELARSVHAISVELAKGTKGDFKNLVKLKEYNAERYNELLIAMHQKRWIWCFGGFKLLPDNKRVAYCPRCGEKYNWRDYTLEIFQISSINGIKKGCMWKDFFPNFIFKEEEKHGP